MNTNDHQCSETFSDVFDSHSGGCRQTCCCGITFFDGYNTGYDWEDGELEGLRKKAQENPARYRECDGSVGCIEIDSKSIVWGCTCDTAKRYEAFIVNHAEQLAEYLNRRAKALREKAGAIEVVA